MNILNYKILPDDIAFIEKFYAENERLSGRKRPDDYIERGLRIIYGKRKPCGWRQEGLASYNKPEAF